MRQTIKLKKEEILIALVRRLHLRNNDHVEKISSLIDMESKKEINNINNLIYDICLYLYNGVTIDNVHKLYNIIVGGNTFIETTEQITIKNKNN